MNGVVGTLKEPRLAIFDELDALITVFGIEIVQAFARKNYGSSDIVFDLHFIGRVKIGPQLIDSVRTVGIVAHAEIVSQQLLVFELQLVTKEAVDTIDAKVLAPVIAPILLIVALDGDDELVNGWRTGFEPFIMRFRI